jgi:hypothetical protein
MKTNVVPIAPFIAAVISLLTACSTSPGEKSANSTASAKLEAKINSFDLESPKFGNKKQIQVEIEIRNAGETTVRLPTKDIGPAIESDGGFAIVIFTPDVYLSAADGLRIPKAKSELAIVELRPHEAISLSEIFEKPAPGVVFAQYSISKEFAERYGTWSGKIEAGSISLRTNK